MRDWLARVQRTQRWPLGLLGLTIITLFLICALFPRWMAPYDPYALVGPPFAPPSGRFLLGTNDIGQDILSELVWGSRVSMSVGIVAGFLAVLGGLLAGVVAGYAGGGIDSAVMRVVDVVLVLPFLPLMILLGAFIGPSLPTLILVISATSWAAPARVIRAQAMALKQEEYLEAARALGAREGYIVRRHVLPGVLPLSLAQFVMAISAAILTEAALSFLGLGDPTVKSWGAMLQFAQARGAFFTGSWLWWVIPPGVCITLTTVGFALLGFVIEELLDPRLRSLR
jgi:ABC-type dipeptide/oligopeptide/nickel transport system permease subunit